MAEEDMGVENDELALQVPGISRVPVSSTAILVSIAGRDYVGGGWRDILRW